MSSEQRPKDGESMDLGYPTVPWLEKSSSPTTNCCFFCGAWLGEPPKFSDPTVSFETGRCSFFFVSRNQQTSSPWKSLHLRCTYDRLPIINSEICGKSLVFFGHNFICPIISPAWKCLYPHSQWNVMQFLHPQ